MNLRELFGGSFAGKRVLVTGHTGFKGAWLSLWLKELGAAVIGFSLEPETHPNLYAHLGLERDIDSHLGDIRDLHRLKELFKKAQPEVVFHLAAQALVRKSYREPAETFSTNVLGTVNILEAVRTCASVRVCQVITSDKCYDNPDRTHPFRETDPMGGHDPYSGSKGCAELVVASYRGAFFPPSEIRRHGVSLSSTRAGNVIGGGDWAEDRIIPDSIRALSQNEDITVRNPRSVRPWQYVLEPLSGYLLLGALQLSDPAEFAEAWNFGPNGEEDITVGEIADKVVRHWGSGSWSTPEPTKQKKEPNEARTLRLDCSKALKRLGWKPVLDTAESVARTVRWYRANFSGKDFDAADFTVKQIREYARTASEGELSWAAGPPSAIKEAKHG